MQRLINIAILLLIVVLLGAYMFTFTVRFDEVAVRTRFNRVVLSGEGQTSLAPGLHFKLPSPIDSVRRYPKNLQHLEDLLQEQQTADSFSVVAKLAVDWRIVDAEQFYTNVRTIQQGEAKLVPLMQDLRQFISNYNFTDLVNPEPEMVRLNELEAEMTAALQSRVLSSETSYGIEVERVAVVRLILPQSTSTGVFTSMTQKRNALAQEARSAGEAEAGKIISEAEANRTRILSFAETAAGQIVNRGRTQVAQLLAVFQQNPGVAIFLQRNDGLRAILENQPTIILDGQDIGLTDMILRAANAETP